MINTPDKTPIGQRRGYEIRPPHRDVCLKCRKAAVACYCQALRPFTSPFPVGILQHPYEAKNSIATARMTHLSIVNSNIFVGTDFTEDRRVNALLDDDSWRHVMLYPGPDAIDLDECFNAGTSFDTRPLFVWVLDAKWQHVNQMLRLSQNLHNVPMIRFNPDRESQFIIRKQPKTICLSTIESIHLVIDRYFTQKNMPNQEHHALLDVFQYLVRQQLEFARVKNDNRHIENRNRRRAKRLISS
jgi:DTW domain-containing protein